MKTSLQFISLLLIFCVTIISCQKIALQPSKDGASLLGENMKTSATAYLQLVSAPYTPIDNDSIERPTILGVQLTNPYLVPNMQQAYRNLGYNPNMATVTNLYVRFKPTTDQLVALDSIMDAQGLELFDTPVDYNVTYEGDYYQDPSIPDSLPTWQYAVVPPNFQFPSGIQYQSLAQIHIPDDNYTAIEIEAERLASIQDGLNQQMMTMNGTAKPNIPQCGTGFHWDYNLSKCVADNCPPGYQWNGTACVPITCPNGYYYNGTACVPYNTTPPPPAADAAIPAGYIKVHDTNLGSDVGVRNTRVVARRWFKIQRTYTDNNGYFVFTKRYPHKVRINVKFKNDYASIRGMRGVRLWQMFLAVKKTLGIYSGDKSNITYTAGLTQTFASIPGLENMDVTVSNKSTRYWAAATTLNTIQEYRDYATTEHIGLPPTGIKILLSYWGHGSGATPMFAKRASIDLPAEFVTWYLGPPAAIISSVIYILKKQVDIVGSYNFGGYATLVSDRMKELFYHELTHSGHYAALGNSWYSTFVNAELFEIISNISSGYSPYGNGANSQSAIVALGESWAYHIGEYLSDKRYGSSSTDYGEQFVAYPNGYISGLSSHLIALENYDPHLTNYPFYWIPKGLYYDMIDARNDKTAIPSFVNIDDQVSGYTNQQFFNAFNSSITTLGAYKQNLLLQNSNNQSTQVISLFSAYGY